MAVRCGVRDHEVGTGVRNQQIHVQVLGKIFAFASIQVTVVVTKGEVVPREGSLRVVGQEVAIRATLVPLNLQVFDASVLESVVKVLVVNGRETRYCSRGLVDFVLDSSAFSVAFLRALTTVLIAPASLEVGRPSDLRKLRHIIRASFVKAPLICDIPNQNRWCDRWLSLTKVKLPLSAYVFRKCFNSTIRLLYLFVALFAATIKSAPLEDLSTVKTFNNIVVAREDSSKPFKWSGLGDSWARSRAYIFNEGENGLFQDARWIFNKAFEYTKTHDNPNLRMFVVGYFTFFYDDGREGDWGDQASFSLRYDTRPTLTLALRKEINFLIRKLNSRTKKAAEDGQPGHNIWDQYWGDKVLLWNMSPDGIVLGNGRNDGADDKNDNYTVREPTPAEFDKWLETGRFIDDPREIPSNMSAMANAALAQQANGVARGAGTDWLWLDYIGPYQRKFLGMPLRPFHPKLLGYHGMTWEIMKKDNRVRVQEQPGQDQAFCLTSLLQAWIEVLLVRILRPFGYLRQSLRRSR
ncbi:hypothetical protein CC86DRAFT_386077 [Ophiobolus disseminans]|uniref:Uncharacterized protein n=1 Tax=Ophiobolus disseminans TaxID=1469910 RepID=A0A6A6ZL68_9PLEO|nr:hypothetical protein CC86DRAFT_386077 [Ophiobolus disseminans]